MDHPPDSKTKPAPLTRVLTNIAATLRPRVCTGAASVGASATSTNASSIRARAPRTPSVPRPSGACDGASPSPKITFVTMEPKPSFHHIPTGPCRDTEESLERGAPPARPIEKYLSAGRRRLLPG